MKVRQRGTNVIASSGVTTEANFQINTSAQAFRILSSGVYSDKIRAVLREIGCNARDSHIQAGTPDRPIEVKLPTALDTSFHIKDWGVGLTHDQVTGLFTTYFASTKAETNEVTGAFGLGSKSPFSYTDSFTVTAVKDGVKRFYTAHLGSNGSPVITQLGDGVKADADWPSGVMVSFPVRPADIEEFKKKAKSVFRWFKVPPVLLGAEAVSYPEFHVQGSNFGLKIKGTDSSIACVLMGNVAYPLAKEGLSTEKSMYTGLVDGGVHVTVPIGAVMPTAAREGLEYDRDTRRNLKVALRGVGRELGTMLNAIDSDQSLTAWQRQVKIRQFAKNLPTHAANQMKSFLGLVDLPPERRMDLLRKFRTMSIPLPKWVGSYGGSVRVHLYKHGERNHTVSRRTVTAGTITRGSARAQDVVHLNYDSKYVIIVGDAMHTHDRSNAILHDDGLLCHTCSTLLQLRKSRSLQGLNASNRWSPWRQARHPTHDRLGDRERRLQGICFRHREPEGCRSACLGGSHRDEGEHRAGAGRELR